MGASHSQDGFQKNNNPFEVTNLADAKQADPNDVQQSNTQSFNQTKRAWASEPINKPGYMIASVTVNTNDTEVQEFDENDKVDSVKRLHPNASFENSPINPQTATKSLAEQLKVETPGIRKSAIFTGVGARSGGSSLGASPVQSNQSINVPEEHDFDVEDSALSFLHKQPSHVSQ